VDVFILVALAFLLVCLGAAGVAALALRRAVKGLTAAGRAASERVGPLTRELADEQAVMAIELDAIGRRRAAGTPRRRAE
jgi:hypothetical protein